jgi:hypothetical protein
VNEENGMGIDSVRDISCGTTNSSSFDPGSANYLIDANTPQIIAPEHRYVFQSTNGYTVKQVLTELQRSERGRFIVTSLDVLPIPEYAPNQVSVYSTENSFSPVEYIWNGGGTSYLSKGDFYGFTNHSLNVSTEIDSTNTTSLLALPENTVATIAPALLEEIRWSSSEFSRKIRADFGVTHYWVGAVVKRKDGKFLFCRKHVADPKHRADFPLFLAAVIYGFPVITEERDLIKDLKYNQMPVYNSNQLIFKQ